MRTLKTSFLILFFFTLSGAFSQVTGFDDYTMNQSGAIDRDGFNEGYVDTYSQWDTNQDNSIDDREFYEFGYARIDADQDGNLSQEEWNIGRDYMYGDYITNDNAADINEENNADPAFDGFDADEDGSISSDEFYNGFGDSGYYNSYDANGDGSIDPDELNQGVFFNMDENMDETLDRNEYDTYSPYYTSATNSGNGIDGNN